MHSRPCLLISEMYRMLQKQVERENLVQIEESMTMQITQHMDGRLRV